MLRRPWRLIHPFQRKYAAWTGGLLFSYSILVFGLAGIAIYIVPAFELSSTMPLEARQQAAAQLLFLAGALWPALLGLIMGSVVFAVYITNRLAGPLHRINQFVKAVEAGDLTGRLFLRKGDELHELAQHINGCVDRFDTTMLEIRARAGQIQEGLQEALSAVQAQDGSQPEWLPSLEAAHKGLSHGVEELVSVIQLSESR